MLLDLARAKSASLRLDFESIISRKRVIKQCKFISTASEIATNIQSIHHLIFDNTDSYILKQSEADRLLFDQECRGVLDLCEQRIEALRHAVGVDSYITCTVLADPNPEPLVVMQNSPQCTAHQLGVIGVLLEHLANVSGKLDQLRNVHLTRILNTRDRRKLEVESARSAPPPDSDEDNAEPDPEFTDEFTTAALVMEENREIQNAMDDQVRQIESRLRDISALSTMFTTRLAEQASEVEKLYDDTVAIGQDIHSANKILEQTNAHYVDFRTWLLFFLITASSALLFLDWYEP